jgi:hypothetical protein
VSENNQAETVSAKFLMSSSRFYRLLGWTTAVSYWIIYAFSSGIVRYYQFNVIPYIKSSGFPNPFIFSNWVGIEGLYNSEGIIWFPNGHLELVLAIVPLFFSFLLSILFAFNAVTTAYSLKLRIRFRGLRATGFVGILPAIFSGGCCASTMGSLLLGSLSSFTPLFTLEYTYPFFLNMVVAIAMTTLYFYSARKLTQPSNSSQLQGWCPKKA